MRRLAAPAIVAVLVACVPQPTGPQVAELTVGAAHACARLTTGVVRCWGTGVFGASFSGPTDAIGPTEIAAVEGATAISAGLAQTCAVVGTGRVLCWGVVGLTATEELITSATPVEVPGITDATSVSVGQFFACARRATGTVACWGRNNWGQLGNGTTTYSSTPVEVVGVTGASAVSAGSFRACARVGDRLSCWGMIPVQLPPRTLPSYTTTPDDEGVTGIGQYAVGASSWCAIQAAGSVRCRGLNVQGQVGDGTDNWGFDSSGIATFADGTAAGVAGASFVDVEEATSCALVSGGGVRCWGNGLLGQLGNGQDQSSNVPVAVSGLTGATRLAVGAYLACAVVPDGVVCWGYGAKVLPDGSVAASNVPVGVAGVLTGA